MKQFIYYIILIFLMSSCQGIEVRESLLPEPIHSFISTYYWKAGIFEAYKKKEDKVSYYSVSLNNCVELNFDINGDWITINCGITGIVPEIILKEDTLFTVVTTLMETYPKPNIFVVDRRYNEYRIEFLVADPDTSAIDKKIQLTGYFDNSGKLLRYDNAN